MFASSIAVFGLFVVVVVVVLSIVKKRILSVFEGKCYKIMSFFFAKFIQCFVSFVCLLFTNQ